MSKKHKVLITGSSGMLGTDLCRELGGDYEVYGIDNRSRAGLNLPYNSAPAEQRYYKCDITDEAETLRVFTETKPDFVIHTAAWTDVDGCELGKDKAYKINSEGTENVALGCKETGATLIYISTDFVFDGKKRSPYKETDRTNPLSIYAESKLLGENAIDRILTGYFIVRTGWLYGKNGKNFVDTIIAKAGTEKELKVVDDQVGSPTYTVDLAKAIRRLLKSAREKLVNRGRAGFNLPYNKLPEVCGIYHISNSGSVSWYEYAKTILKLTGSTMKVVPITSEELNRPANRPAMSVLDNSKFIKLTGYKMRNWKEALKDYITNSRHCEKAEGRRSNL